MTGHEVALADVLQTMRQAKTMVCDFVTTTTVVEGQPPDLFREPLHGRISMYSEGDTRAVLYEYEWSDTKGRSLWLEDRVYCWDGDKVRVENNYANPLRRWATEDWLGRLLEIRDSPDRKLGEETINGRRAVGFEIAGWKHGLGTRPTKGSPTPTDSEHRFRVWVDVERSLPVRLEIEQEMAMPDLTATIHHRWDNIQWNVALDAEDFRPPAEEDIAKDATTQLPPVDEATFTDAMRVWLDSKDKAAAGIALFKALLKKKEQEKGEALPAQASALFERAALDAGYPERLDMVWLMSTFGARAALAKLGDTLAKLEPVPKDLDDEERMKLARARARESATATAQVTVGSSIRAASAGAFYSKLANEGRDPEYFGATVKPGDSEAILLRWKLDDGRYRVIYGDLRAETVDAAD
jgi:hypothetical protein